MRLLRINIICVAIVMATRPSYLLNSRDIAVQNIDVDTSFDNFLSPRKNQFDDPYETRRQGQSVASCKYLSAPIHQPKSGTKLSF